jgi:hypothetical protein
VSQVKESEKTPLLSVLLEGPPGAGKTVRRGRRARRRRRRRRRRRECNRTSEEAKR